MPLASPRGRAPSVSGVKSTLITASLVAIRQMGWEERYHQALPPDRHDVLRSLVAGSWSPIELAKAHYTACDKMRLTCRPEMIKMGEDVFNVRRRASSRPWRERPSKRGPRPGSYSGAGAASGTGSSSGRHRGLQGRPQGGLRRSPPVRASRAPYFRAAFRSYFRDRRRAPIEGRLHERIAGVCDRDGCRDSLFVGVSAPP